MAQSNITQQIYNILTRRRYNRGEPLLSSDLDKIITYYVERNEPIPLVGFWGIGSKDCPNWADIASIDFFNALREDVRKIYKPSIDFVFIFATNHAEHNGYSQQTIQAYTFGIIELFQQYHFRYCFLHDLWKKYDISFEKIQLLYDKKSDIWWQNIENRQIIELNALERNTHLEPRIAAQKYFIMRDLEKTMLEQEFKGYIFHAFSDPELKNVLPHMPTLYFYARKGWSNAPWFVNYEKE